MKRKAVISAGLLAIAMGVAWAADSKSDAKAGDGLKIGDEAGYFEVTDCSGPAKGKELCYR